MNYSLFLPNDFEEYEWEVELKGCLELDIEINNDIYTFNFYDMTRLNQTIDIEFAHQPNFFDENIVVLTKVNIKNINDFVERVINTKYLLCFVKKY